MQLALFDLDHTLLSGDSDVLWCDFLVEQGLQPDELRQRSDDVAARYAAGTIVPKDYCDFYAQTLAGYAPAELLPLRERFLREWIRPRIPHDARALLNDARRAGATLVLTTATNRAISELTAAELEMDQFFCTELELVDGRYTGRTTGAPNMRAGKLERIRQWMADSGLAASLLKQASFYSDSINDLALLSAVGRAVVVDPDPRLESTAIRKGWAVLRLDRAR